MEIEKHKNILLSVAVMHPQNSNLRKLISTLPKGVQIVSCVTIQSDSFTDEIELIANTENIVSLNYYYTSYDVDFDFSKVRNYMDSYASGEWILHIDSDEYVGNPKEELLSIIQDLNKTDAVGAYLTIAGAMYRHDAVNDLRERYANPSLRIVRNCESMKWQGIVHEWVDSIDDDRNYVYDSNVILIHDGYLITDKEFQDKGLRNGKLLIREYTRNATDRIWNYMIKTFKFLQIKE